MCIRDRTKTMEHADFLKESLQLKLQTIKEEVQEWKQESFANEYDEAPPHLLDMYDEQEERITFLKQLTEPENEEDYFE